MQAGSLRHRITIVGGPDTQNSYGEPIPSGAVVAQVRANVRPLEGREQFSGQQFLGEITHEIETRYVPGIKPKMRVLFEGRELDILAAPNVDERNRRLRILAREIV